MYKYNQKAGGGSSSGLGEFWNAEPAKKPTCGAEDASPATDSRGGAAGRLEWSTFVEGSSDDEDESSSMDM